MMGILAQKDLHLWYASYPAVEKNLTALQRIILPAELSRAKRLIKKSDQVKFILGRAILRVVLSHYLEKNPAEILFDMNEHGKPFLFGHALQFNLAHSGDYLFIGVTLHQHIGVDVEQVRPYHNYLSLAKRFFTSSEYAAINNVDDFYRCWTRKEAFVKAMGAGLSFGLSNFEVTTFAMSSAQSALLSIRGDVIIAKQWMLRSVRWDELPSDYFAAVAVFGEIKNIIIKNAAFLLT